MEKARHKFLIIIIIIIIFLAHFFFAFSQLPEGLLQVNYVHSFISNLLWYIFNLSVEHFWRCFINQQTRI